MLTEASNYDELYQKLPLGTSRRVFNIATACLRPSCRWLGQACADLCRRGGGKTTRTTFDEIADKSRRFANVLKADGLMRGGDRVAVFSVASRWNCRWRTWRRSAPAWSRSRCSPLFGEGRAGVPPVQFGRGRPSSPTSPAGEKLAKDSRPASRPSECLRHRPNTRPPAQKPVLAIHRRGHRPSLRPSIRHATIPA